MYNNFSRSHSLFHFIPQYFPIPHSTYTMHPYVSLLYSVYLFIYAYDSEIIYTTYDITIIQYIKHVITAYITVLQCLQTLVPPKGRGGMSFGRLKYII
jgi:hypothetical protein